MSAELAGEEALVSFVSDSPAHSPSERLFFEVNLLKLSGVLFCLDKAEATRRNAGVFDFAKLTTEPVSITPNPIFGYPSVLACKVCDVILKKLSDYGQPVPEHVSFSKRELDELVGHASWGGRNGRQLARALYQLQGTMISARFFDKRSGRWNVSSFNVLSEVLIAGRGLTIEACSVRLNPLIIESLRARHYACLNHARMQTLDIIGRQMFKRVFFHLSNLYDGRNRQTLQYVKDYGAICREWLGSLKELRFKSKIEQEQLGPHLRALQECGLIRSYQIERNARRDGFNISFRPGKGFFDDYARFYATADQPAFRFALAADESGIQRPLELVAHFYKCLYRVDILSPNTLSDKEVALAKDVLETMSLDEAKALSEFAIREAERTKFDIKSFGAVRQYLLPWRAAQDQRAALSAANAKRIAEDKEESLRTKYETYFAGAIEQIRASLSAETLSEIDEEARRSVEGYELGGKTMARIRANRIISERYKVQSFEQWCFSNKQAL